MLQPTDAREQAEVLQWSGTFNAYCSGIDQAACIALTGKLSSICLLGLVVRDVLRLCTAWFCVNRITKHTAKTVRSQSRSVISWQNLQGVHFDFAVCCRPNISLSMVKTTSSLAKLRFEAVTLKQHHPDWSFRKIAKKIHCSHVSVSTWVARYAQCGQLEDKPRSGRPRKADAAAVQHIVNAAEHPECRTAADIAAKVQQDYDLKISASTVRFILRENGLQHLSPRAVPVLTCIHKKGRVTFAREYLRRTRSSKRRFLCTDSKVFLLRKLGRAAFRWCFPAARGIVPKHRHSIAAHVYMGISYHGATKLMFVTGTHKQPSKFINPKTKRLHAGVGGEEYNQVLAELFVPEGKRLFQGVWAKKWQLQQDNAPPHKTASNMAYIKANVPGGHFLDWPANSPDLSPIETMWAWMDHKLHTEYKPNNIDELKQCLQEINKAIPASMLHNLFDGLDARMKQVIELGGDYIGK